MSYLWEKAMNASLRPFRSEVIYNVISDRHESEFIPFEFQQYHGGPVVFSAAARYMDIAETFYKKYAGNLFSGEAQNYLVDRMAAELEKTEYEVDESRNPRSRYGFLYGMDDYKRLAFGKIKDSTLILDSDSPYKNISNTYDPFYPYHVYFGTVIGNEIVSVADCSMAVLKYPDLTVFNVGIGTHPDHRNNGYAVSNVAAMCDYLISRGKTATYSCHSENIPSQRTALSAGFTEIAKQQFIIVKKR